MTTLRLSLSLTTAFSQVVERLALGSPELREALTGARTAPSALPMPSLPICPIVPFDYATTECNRVPLTRKFFVLMAAKSAEAALLRSDANGDGLYDANEINAAIRSAEQLFCSAYDRFYLPFRDHLVLGYVALVKSPF